MVLIDQVLIIICEHYCCLILLHFNSNSWCVIFQEEYYTRVQTTQENRASKSGFYFRHNRNLIIPDLLTSCIQCGSAECRCFRVKRKRRSRKTVKMKFECDVCHKVLASRKTLKQQDVYKRQ